MVSDLYKEFYEYLGHSLDPLSPGEKAFFESIRLNTASVECWGESLKRLSGFLARKSGRGVMVFIDEYETPYRYAYEFAFFAKVRPSYPSRLWSRLALRTVIQANDFFGRDALSALLKVTMIYFGTFYGGTSNILIQSNANLEYALLAGVTPVPKAGWYSGLNNIEVCCFMLARCSTT
jgi:hypothetical protein